MSSTSGAAELDPPRSGELLHRAGLGHRRAREVEVLEQPVDERAADERVERGRRLAGLGGARWRRHARQPQDALEVEAVAAARVGAECAVREPLGRRARACGGLGQDARRVRQRGARRAGADAAGRAERGQHGADRRGRVEPAEQPRGAAVPAALEDGLRGRRRGGDVAAGQRARDPVDRRPARARRGQPLAVDAAGQDQPLARSRHGHVEEAPLLLGLLLLLELGQSVPVERGHQLAAADRREPQAGAAVAAEQQPVARAAGRAAEVGHADDGELEPLGAMDRHQPHGVEPLGLERRLSLARLDQVLGGGEGDEAAQVRALRVLVLAREPHQLAQVRQPPLAAGAGQHREVVAGGHDRALEQLLGGRALGARPLGGEEAREGGEAVALVRRQGGGPGRPTRRRAASPTRRDRLRARPASPARARPCPPRRTARRAPPAAPARRAGWRAPTGRRCRRGPAPATSSRGRRRRTSAGPAPRAPARAAAARPWRARARRCRRGGARRRPRRAAGARPAAPRRAATAACRSPRGRARPRARPSRGCR